MLLNRFSHPFPISLLHPSNRSFNIFVPHLLNPIYHSCWCGPYDDFAEFASSGRGGGGLIPGVLKFFAFPDNGVLDVLGYDLDCIDVQICDCCNYHQSTNKGPSSSHDGVWTVEG